MWIKICFKQYQIYQMKNMHKIVEAMLSNRLVFENYLYIEMYFNWFSYAYDIKYHIYIKRFSIPHHILTLHLQMEWKTVSLFVYRIIFNFEHVNHSFHWLLNDFGVTMQMHWHWGWLPVIYQFINIFIYIVRYCVWNIINNSTIHDEHIMKLCIPF